MTERGLSYELWRRMESERRARGWTQVRLADETSRHTADGKPIARNTLTNLRVNTRPPQLHVIHALADTLDIPRGEAEELAGLESVRPREQAPDDDLRAKIAKSRYTEQQRQVLLHLLDALDAENERGQRRAV